MEQIHQLANSMGVGGGVIAFFVLWAIILVAGRPESYKKNYKK